MDAARCAGADDEVPAEAETFHHFKDGAVTLVARMEGAIDIDINEQIVGELAEAFADNVAASVARFDRAEGQGHLFLAGAFDGFPACLSEYDLAPARFC